MSLLGRRKPAGSGGRGGYEGERKGANKTKQKRIFRIADTELDIALPEFKSSKTTTRGGSAFDFLSSTKRDEEFTPFTSSSSASSSFSSGSTSLRPGVDTALASSKLASLSSAGPIEPSPRLGKRKLKAAKKHEKSLTKGKAWFDMAKTEITKEKKNDLDVLKLRSAMEGIHHYKRNHMTHTPQYFHVGTVVETKADFFSSRIPKKQRKKTIAEEFQADFGM